MIAVSFGRDDVGAGLRTGKSPPGDNATGQADGQMTARGHVHLTQAKRRGLMTFSWVAYIHG